MKIYPVSLATLESGAVVEAFDEALATVWADITDPNKVEDAARSVTLKLTVKPAKGNLLAPALATAISTNLAPYHPIPGQAYLDVQEDGVTASQVDPEQRNYLHDEEGEAAGPRPLEGVSNE